MFESPVAKTVSHVVGMAACFSIVAGANILLNGIGLAAGVEGLEDALESKQGTFVKNVIVEPLREEALFRLLPILLISATGNNRAAILGSLLFTSAGFGAYHWIDDNWQIDFDRMDRVAFAQRAVGGIGLFGLAYTRGVTHSVAAHAGLNAGILAVGSALS